MLKRNQLNEILDISQFIEHGKFALNDNHIPSLYALADTQFGDNNIMLSFEFTGYNVAIQIGNNKRKVLSCQIEHFNISVVEEDYLTSIITYHALTNSQISKLIGEIYEDDTERVVFLTTGTMLYYTLIKNNCNLSLIIADDEASKNLVRATLRKVV